MASISVVYRFYEGRVGGWWAVGGVICVHPPGAVSPVATLHVSVKAALCLYSVVDCNTIVFSRFFPAIQLNNAA